ncbi:cytochrome P450 4V2 [Diplogelasinospora grovesii]|uniref:Cytochrome P450 4V2 n=1 Tax=Diplogelasinospora grovesii TaxID=303347 RepID=A0AAN6NGB1_9PEZI|nr:cytochrome P450 4V2 [Diplogelasinospora grovesii]
MGLPYKSVSAIALGGAYLLSSRRVVIGPEIGFLAAFSTLWLFQFLCWVVWEVILYPNYFSPLIGLPEPTGNSLFMGQYARIAREPTGMPALDWINSIPNDGLIRYKALFNQERLLVTNPKALAEVLVSKNYDFQKPYQIRFSIGRILGIGVLLAEGDEHKVQRRNLMPAFAFRHIKDLYSVFWSKSREVVQAMTDEVLLDAKKPENLNLDGKKDTAVMEVGGWASRVTLDIIGVAGLGRDFGAIKDPNTELNQTYQFLFKPSRQARILALLGMLLPGWILERLPVKRNEDVMAAAGVIRATCADLIRDKKQKLARLREKGGLGEEAADVDILSVALESGGFTDENLVDQLMTFLAAGHETTATSMTWAVYMLARYPDIQARLRKEIRERLPSPVSDASTVSSLDIDHMPYLNAVCNEVLRYYGPVPMTLRQAACDTSIQGHFVPKGTRVMITPWAINKSIQMWGQDALQFNPDRWMPDGEGDKKAASGGATSNYAFMTFLHGPRSCIGQAFAKAEFACLLAAWVGRFSFELHNKEEMDESKVVIKGGVTARPANGMHVRATVVEGW